MERRLVRADYNPALVAAHERASAGPEVRLLNNADALSFFSRQAAGRAVAR